MILDPYDYIRIMEQLGLFRPDHDVPDCNSAVWRSYLGHYDSYLGGVKDIQIVCTPEGLGFYSDPLDEGAPYSWALLGPVSHPTIPFTASQVLKGWTGVLGSFAKDGIENPCIVTETFDLLTPAEPEIEQHFLWLNSPRARIHSPFEAYETSLAASRRKQMRRLFRSYDENPDFRFDFSDRPLTAAEMDFILHHTHARWGEEWNYAIIQTLWPLAISSVLPHRARYMRVYNKDQLVFINSYVARDEVMLSQATCRSVDHMFSGLGVMIDFKTIKILSEGKSSIYYLDPTCRVNVDTEGAEQITIAKREVVNEDARKAVLAAGYDLPELECAYPHLHPDKGWVIPEPLVAIGKAA